MYSVDMPSEGFAVRRALNVLRKVKVLGGVEVEFNN